MTRMSKKYATIYIEEEVIRKAKEIGLNISKTCENALKEAIIRLESPKIQYLTQKNNKKEPTENTNKDKWWARSDLNARPTGISNISHCMSFDRYLLSL